MASILLTIALLLGLATGAAAQTRPVEQVDEGFGFGLFVRPALDAGDPWLINGLRVSLPASPRISIDVESAMVLGGSNEFARVHGLFGAQLRLLRASGAGARQAHYWIAGVQVLPGDKLNPDGSVREQRLYANAVGGIGGRQLYGRAMRVLTEASLSVGNGFIASVTAGVQWGPHRGPRR